MADDAQKQSGAGPRVVVRISPEMQFLLSQVARHSLCTKKDLHDEIWRAGIKSHLGVTPEEVDEASVTSLPRGSAASADAKKLTRLLLNR
jgi:hypothetical protein